MSNFYLIFLGDSYSTLWFVTGPLILLFCLRMHPQLYGFVHCFVCCGFIHCFRADSSTLLTGDSSPLFVWIHPLLPIKLGFMTAYSVTLCEDSSSDLWIRPLFCLLRFYPLFRADSSTLLTGDSSPLFLRLDLFWYKKEAAASTVCLTGFPCHFFWFFPMTGFSVNLLQ